jgi:hypothetical protein
MIDRHISAFFLNLVAEDLISRFGKNLSKIVVVFPSTRAKLFFNNYLYHHAKIPLWSPQYKTIESLFRESSSSQVCDDILLIIELYKTYVEVYNNHSKKKFEETLDDFFIFGETLLSDFDEIDKNYVNTKFLFGNLKNLNELQDDFSYLSKNQIQTLISHFKAFQCNTLLQNNFCSIWNILSEVYSSFKSKLEKKNIAYLGMLMRNVIRDVKNLFNENHYVFVGFNVLNKCEEKLFDQLKEKSLFYWDYDKYYIETEAGKFVKQNINKYGSALQSNQFDVFLHPDKKITFLSSFSESGQLAVTPQWISSLQKKFSSIQPDSAIVLCNEAILPTLIQTISLNEIENINITMGFPIMQTEIISFLQILIEMQIYGYRPSDQSFKYEYVLPVLNHPYTSLIFPKANQVEKKIIENNIFYPTLTELQNKLFFTYVTETLGLIKYLLKIIRIVGDFFKNDPYSILHQESIFRSYLLMNRLYGLFLIENLNVSKVHFSRLLHKYFSKIKIPFNGDPVVGMQIMGVLETRTLDFNNLLIFNTNEGYMPGNKNENTFIPQFIRSQFGMSTFESHDAVYAYYFYRLLTRAKNITLVYTTNETKIGKAEMSRFLLQLLVDPRLKLNIKQYVLQTNIVTMRSQYITVDKDKFLLEKIKNKYDLNTNIRATALSSTALSCFVSCSYRFYLEYIQELKKENELVPKINSSVFGSIFHEAAKILYQQVCMQNIDYESLNVYIKFPQRIENIVLKAFQKEFFKGRNIKKENYNGEQLINLHIICKLLECLIRFDQKHLPFTILGIEYNISGTIFIKKENICVKINGIIDRLQREKDGTHVIIDYKTGNNESSFKSLKELFDKKNMHIFQVFIYAFIYSQLEKKNPIIPALLCIRQIGGNVHYPHIITYNNTPVNDFNFFKFDFEKMLSNKISELFNSDIPFQQTKNIKACRYCNFKERCSR